MDFCNAKVFGNSMRSIQKVMPKELDSSVASSPTTESRLLKQQLHYERHLSDLVASLQGANAPKDFPELIQLLSEAESKARVENTRILLCT